MKEKLARLILLADKHAFYVFIAVCYLALSVILLMTGWVGFFIWLTSSLALGIVLGRTRMVRWAMKIIAKKE